MNMKILGSVLVCATLGLVTYAAADGTTTAPVATTAAAPNPKDEVICRTEPPPAGTRIGRRKVCATRGEWDLMAKNAQEGVRNLQLAPMINRDTGTGK